MKALERKPSMFPAFMLFAVCGAVSLADIQPIPDPISTPLRTERDYQQHVNTILQGQLEVVQDDGTRVDILTDHLAIEVDFAPKWAEGIGQAVHYSRLTGKRACVLLIVKDASDEKHVEKCIATCDALRVNGFAPVVIVYRGNR